ncbi:MAG TPA: hypothetical protein VH951_03075 [Dehalococcoidia bacterium]
MKGIHVDRDSLVSIAQMEPERTKLLLKVAAGGAAVLFLWTWAGRALAGDIIFAFVDVVAMLAYSVAIIVLTGNLVRGADRWQVESAMQARRLLSTGRQRVEDLQRADTEGAATFDHWYFVLRLEDEIKRARRTGTPVSIVIMQISAAGEQMTPALVEQINFDVAQLAASHTKTMSMPSAIAPCEYAFLLPNTDRNEAKSRIAPLLAPLGDYWCDFGIAVYPDDGSDAEALVALAQQQSEEDKTEAA